jgi:glycosyltransferase involved in cell wall biosynthesis
MRKKIKLGLVSSFNHLCGNATFSEELAKGFSRSYEVRKIDVPINLQENYDRAIENSICMQISECDAVNIQVELGLYGPTPEKAQKVIKRFMSASKNLSITMHRVDTNKKNFFRSLYKEFKLNGVKFLLKSLVEYWKQTKLANVYRNVVLAAQKKNASIICHTHREYYRIKKIAPNVEVFIHPILWKNRNNLSELSLDLYFDKPTYNTIGLFGFISEYKNYDLVADAVKNEKINVLIAGGCHPMSPQYGKSSRNFISNKDLSGLSYLRKISTLFMKPSFKGRVFSITAPSDDLLIQLIKSVDIVCVPYLETGQSGSGIASMAIQYGKKVIFSDNKCTSELIKFLNESPILFDADSPLSLIGALKQVAKKDLKINFSEYTFETQEKVYFKSMRL